PRISSEKNSPYRSGRSTPSVFVCRVIRLRAALLGEYRNRAAAARTRSRVAGFTGPLSLSTRETVAIETSASRATSRIVARISTFWLESRRVRPTRRLPGAAPAELRSRWRWKRLQCYVTECKHFVTARPNGRPRYGLA